MKKIINILKSARIEIFLRWYRGENSRIQITLFESIEGVEESYFDIISICIVKLFFTVGIKYEVE